MKKNNKKLLVALSFILCLFINVSGAKASPLSTLDTTPPKLNLEICANEDTDTYKLIANEPLSFLKIQLRENLFAALFKGGYDNYSKDTWHMEAQQEGLSVQFIDVFESSKSFTLPYQGSTITLTINEDESEFLLAVTGDMAKKLRNQKSMPLVARDASLNEFSGEFKIAELKNLTKEVEKKEVLKEDKKTFNTGSNDYPVRLSNYREGNSNWTANLNSVISGDRLRLSVYYHNGTSEVAKNAKITLTLPMVQTPNLVVTLKTSANGFDDYVTSVNIPLSPSNAIEFQEIAKWYSDYNGSRYVVRDITTRKENNEIVFDLGDVYPGYMPNDGYVVFDMLVL